MGRITTTRRVRRIGSPVALASSADTLVVEEPLEIRLRGEPWSVTMRTPGNDFDLVAGFLVSEGVVSGPRQLSALRYCAGAVGGEGNTYNVVDAELAPSVALPGPSLRRHLATSSACGVCGRNSLEGVRVAARWPVADDPLVVEPATLVCLPERLLAEQRLFARTGGLHAAALFTADGRLRCLREDVGRHNAVDKVVGWALRQDGLPLRGSLLMVSGRASFELTQKAWMAGIPLLAAVSAPSSLAVDLAEEAGMTLIGFLRGSTMNVYTGAHRLSGASDPDLTRV